MYQPPSNDSTNRNPPPIPNGQAQHPQPNGHHSHPPANGPPSGRSATHQSARERQCVLGVPSVTIIGNQMVHGDSGSSSERAFTRLKGVGDGSFGTVSLVDWHGALPPNTPLSAMQCGASGARAEWSGKRLVALKRMRRSREGGWDECKKEKELQSLRAIPSHPNIIPLYDFFFVPATKELYFVFESMEGNLYQLIRSRRNRPLPGGLVSSIFRQVVSGLHHIHASGYFHRDMKPENLLVTTTGLYDYHPVSPTVPPGTLPATDVVVSVKLADFGLARETNSSPPYTEYVSTRWYRAPEVLLRSRDYSNPVDMWALGTIMAELITLRPLFPGENEVNQVARICEILGDPSDEYGVDARGVAVGGGKWNKGVRMAKACGFTFPKVKPIPIPTLFDSSVHPLIIECISDLLKYDPDKRLTSKQCLEHPYLIDTTPKNNPPYPAQLFVDTNVTPQKSTPQTLLPTPVSFNDQSMSPRAEQPTLARANVKPQPVYQVPPPQIIPPSNSINGNGSHRAPFYQHPSGSGSTRVEPSGGSASSFDIIDINILPGQDAHVSSLNGGSTVASSVYLNGGDRISHSFTDSTQSSDGDAMDISSPLPDHAHSTDQPMEIQTSPLAPEDPARQNGRDASGFVRHILPHSRTNGAPPMPMPNENMSKFKGLARKKGSKWALAGIFSHGDKQSQLPPVDELHASSETVPSLKRTQSSSTDSSDMPPPADWSMMDAKTRKKEVDRVTREAELSKRALAFERSREQARAVMRKRNQELSNNQSADIDWLMTHTNNPFGTQKVKAKQRQALPVPSSSATVNAASGRFRDNAVGIDGDPWTDYRGKARRRDMDDDHSMSSSDVQSLGRASVISFATVATAETGESDPGPGPLRQRPSLGIGRMQSMSSLRTSFTDGDFPVSARSSNSLSYEHQLANDFDSRTSFSSFDTGARSSLSDTGSPPPMQMLSLSSSSQRRPHPTVILPSMSSMQSSHLLPPGANSPYEYGQNGHAQHPSSPSPGPHGHINPMFKVPPLQPAHEPSSDTTLPSFSQIASMADQCPPLSPMSFHVPEES